MRVGVRRGRNPPRNLQISSVFKSVFSTVSFLKEAGRKKASVRRALHSGSRLPATHIPRHLNSLATTRSGPSAVACGRRSSQGSCALGWYLSWRTPRVRVDERRGQNALRPRAAGACCFGGRGCAWPGPSAVRAGALEPRPVRAGVCRSSAE